MAFACFALGACESRSADGDRTDTQPAARAETTMLAPETSRRSPDTAVGAEPRDTGGRARAPQSAGSYEVARWRPAEPAACKMPEPAPSGAPDARTVTVFFGCQPPTGILLNAVRARRVAVPSGTDAKETAVRVLLRGPTAEEKRLGYLSTFGPSSANVSFKIRERQGLATVDFDPAIRQVEFIFVSMMDVAQIVATLGQFPEVRRVEILIGGEQWCRVIGGC
jgi:hypothetical protein